MQKLMKELQVRAGGCHFRDHLLMHGLPSSLSQAECTKMVSQVGELAKGKLDVRLSTPLSTPPPSYPDVQ